MVEFLDALIPGIGDEDIALSVDRNSNLPFGENLLTRLLPVSVTSTFPCASIAIARGPYIWSGLTLATPCVSPFVPHIVKNLPFESNF